MKYNISKFKYCYGCGVCVSVCPVKIISFEENEEGFYVPIIHDQDKCINCGLCLKVCSFNHDEIFPTDNKTDAYASWSTTPAVRRRCSSGGIGFEVGRLLIEEGYKAVGVRYNVDKCRAEDYIAESIEQFIASMGSKYIPSYTTDAFSLINRENKYLITGTPCQIDSFRRMIKYLKVEDNFVLLDFFCHGVPSNLLWRKYIKEANAIVGDIKDVVWRSKTTGWQDSWSMNLYDSTSCTPTNWHDSYQLKIWEKKSVLSSRKSQGDLFFKFFLSDACLNKCCYKSCKYKLCSSSADIRIGDFWGNKYKNNQEGVSSVLTFTKRGNRIIESLKTLGRCDLVLETIEEAISGQMPQMPTYPILRKCILKQFKSDRALKAIASTTLRLQWWLNVPEKFINKIKSKL